MNARQAVFLLLLAIPFVLAGLAGCTGTTGPTPRPPVLTPEPVTPVTTATIVTPLPVNELARLTVGHFGMDPSSGDVFEFVGTIQVAGGPYQDVQVILRYPDTQDYTYDAGGMGGANATRKSFYLYPANRYLGTNPEKIVSIDGKRYSTVYRYEDGTTLWIATSTDLLPS